MFRSAILRTLAGIAVCAFLAVSFAEARPNPEIKCKDKHGPYVRCEAKYVDPAVPEWSTTGGVEKDYGRGYGEGFGRDMELSGEWSAITASYRGQVIATVWARKIRGTTEFRRTSPVVSVEQVAVREPP